MTVFNFRLYLSICCSPSSTGGSGDKCSLVCDLVKVKVKKLIANTIRYDRSNETKGKLEN